MKDYGFNKNQIAGVCEGQRLLMKQLGCTLIEANQIMIDTLESIDRMLREESELK